MSSDPNDSSYDLRRAARLTAGLTGAQSSSPSEAGGYVAFSAGALRFGAAPEVTAASPAAPTQAGGSALVDFDGVVPSSAEMMGSAGWGRMLEWCADALRADSAFIVDARGLGIASSGNLPQEEIDETGARLMAAFEQADQFTPTLGSALSVSVELESGSDGSRWLVGIQVPSSEGERLVIGIVLDRPLSASARQKIAEAFTKKARGL